MNFAVCSAPRRLADTDAPRPTASDDPNESKRIACGMWRSSPCLFSWLHITPDDEITATLDRS